MRWGVTKGKYAPRLYSPSVLKFIEKLWRMDGATKMREVILEGAYGVLPPGDSYDDSLPITFLRATEMMPNLRVDLSSCHRVARDYFNPKARISIGDVLLAVKGATIASNKCVAVIEEEPGEAVINGSIFRMQFKSAVSPKFAAVILDTPLMKRQMRLGLVANNGVDYLDKTLIHGLVFPVSSPEVQQQIVSIYEGAAAAYRTARADAEQMLEGIDDYLLAELGITLPPEPANTLASRIFTAQRREVAGWRFDARVHGYDFQLTTDRYPCVPLKQVVFINPRTVYANITDATPLTFIPMEAISDEDGTIPCPQERPFGENIGYTNFQEGDLLWAKITPCMENGKSAVAEGLLNGFGFGSTEYHVIRPCAAEVSVHYLHALLRLKRLRKAAENFFGGSSGHQRVDVAFFYRLTVPLPDINTQNRLASHIQTTRQEAKRLRQQAETELETAKRRIEAMLLGEAA